MPLCGSTQLNWSSIGRGPHRIPLFLGLIYTTDGCQGKGNMGVGFYMHEGAAKGLYKVGRDEEGASSNRVEHAAVCIALEDALKYAKS